MKTFHPIDYGRAIKTIAYARYRPLYKVAEISGISSETIWAIAKGKQKPNAATLESIANGLRVPVWLIVLAGTHSDDFEGVESFVKKSLVAINESEKPKTIDDSVRHYADIFTSQGKVPTSCALFELTAWDHRDLHQKHGDAFSEEYLKSILGNDPNAFRMSDSDWP